MKNLYRRYRPLSLEDVVGQEQVTRPLSSALKAGKISHAYLFIGPRGCGKTSVARILAHQVNGFKYELEDDYVDIIEIDGASNRGIDDIRELREKATIAPTSGKYKVYIIDEVHSLTPQAFNALLKTLEEPPAHVIFIMATTEGYKVPVTITSRSQIYTFQLADSDTMLKFLERVAKDEGISITKDALSIIAKRGGGSFRDSLSLLDQLSTLTDDQITKETVVTAMGLPADEKIATLLQEYSNGDVVKITTVTKELLSSGIKPEILTEELIRAIIDDPQLEYIDLLSQLTEVKPPFDTARLLVALLSKATAHSSNQEPRVKLAPAPPRPMANTVEPASQDPAPQSKLKNDSLAEAPKSDRTEPTPPSFTSFSWSDFVSMAQAKNEVIAKQLAKCEYELKSGALHLYPRTKIIRSILTSKNNQAILSSLAPSLKLEFHEAGEHPSANTTPATKDSTLTKISAIMGGEVINDGGISPF